jgi:hypothetical protein
MHMASANDPRQTEGTFQQGAARAQNGGDDAGNAGTQAQSRRDVQTSRQGSQGGRSLSASRGRRDLSTSANNPFDLMWQLSREMDRMMSAAFGGPALLGSNFRSMLHRGRDDEWGASSFWNPRVDVEQRGESIVIRADSRMSLRRA